MMKKGDEQDPLLKKLKRYLIPKYLRPLKVQYLFYFVYGHFQCKMIFALLISMNEHVGILV